MAHGKRFRMQYQKVQRDTLSGLLESVTHSTAKGEYIVVIAGTEKGDAFLPESEEEEEERIFLYGNLRTTKGGRQPVGPVNGYAKPAIRADRPTP